VKVKLLTSRSGSDGAFGAGDVIDVPGDEAARMIGKGQAEPVRAERAPEKAVARRRKPKAD